MEISEKILEEVVRKVVAEHLAGRPGDAVKQVDPDSGVITVKAARVLPEPFETGTPGTRVFLKDAVTLAESPRLMFGILEMKEGSSFDWTLKYDEVDYIIDGTLDVIVNGKTSRACKGDIIYIPKDSSITFSTPESTRFMYVTYPADWSAQ